MTNNKIKVLFEEILSEYLKATLLHPKWPACLLRQITIMNEEAGESLQATINYLEGKGEINDIREELIQTAAMSIRALINLNERSKYENCDCIKESLQRKEN